jgi:branched-chain amino acid transport system substrate-binding protein
MGKKRFKRVIAFPLVAILVIPVLSACGGGASTPAPSGSASPPSPAGGMASPGAVIGRSPTGDTSKGTIKIVSSWPLTGQAQKVGNDSAKAAQMAIADHGGAAGGYAIAYEPLDDATAAKGSWDSAKESENANKAIADADTMVYLGTYNSGAAKVSIPIVNQAGLGMISWGNTWPGLTKKIAGMTDANEPEVYYPTGKRNYMRVVPTDDLQGSIAAQWAKDLGAKKVYILDDTELYGHGISLIFADAAKKLGLEVVGGPEGIDKKAPDYRALMTNIRSKSPDLIFFGGITENNAGKLVQDMRAAGMTNVKFMGPDGIFNQGFIDAAGAAAENVYATFGGVPASQLTGKGADWYQRFKAQYHEDPEAYAVYAYEAASVALNAIDKVGKKDRQAILDAMRNTKDYDGVLGKWSFTDTGDTSSTTMSGNQVKGGKWEFVKTLKLSGQ